MTELATVTDITNPETAIRRDRYGRYLIPHPDTGHEQAWTRATTLANTLADRFGLEKWAKRNVALGLAARTDLYARVASCTVDDKKTLDRLVSDAEEAAAASSGANLGTALHRFTERLDAGQDVQVPPPWDRDVAAYQAAMTSHGITVLDNWIERVLIVPELDVAGTCDRVVYSPDWPAHRIGDLKTGKDIVRYGMGEIAIQLALYAHATHSFDPAANTCEPITPKIDQDRAVVMHLPVGQATCTIYEVNIAAGWEMAKVAYQVREWRKRDDLAMQLVPTHTDDGIPICGNCGNSLEACEGGCYDSPPHPDALTWLHQRVEAIKQAGHGGLLAAKWSHHRDIPTFPKGGPTTQNEFDQIDTMCDQVETETGMPFGPSNPTNQPMTKSNRKSKT